MKNEFLNFAPAPTVQFWGPPLPGRLIPRFEFNLLYPGVGAQSFVETGGGFSARQFRFVLQPQKIVDVVVVENFGFGFLPLFDAAADLYEVFFNFLLRIHDAVVAAVEGSAVHGVQLLVFDATHQLLVNAVVDLYIENLKLAKKIIAGVATLQRFRS